MKKQKRLNLGLLGVFMLCILAGTFLARPMKVEAASIKKVWVYETSGEQRTKVGKTYYWRSQNRDKIYASTSKKGKGKVIAKASKGRSIQGSLMFDGSKFYYAENDNSNGYIYSVKTNGKGRKYLGKIKAHVYMFERYYSGNLYISGEVGEGMHTYGLNMKTKKAKRIAKYALPSDQYKQYIVFTPSPFEAPTSKAYVYNCKTGKLVKISDKVGTYGANFSSGRVYYTEIINEKSARIMSCGLNGKDKKTVVKKLSARAHDVGKMTSKYVYYIKWGKTDQDIKYYRYDVKKKKATKIRKSKYKDRWS